jgi:hypothetical protein
MGSLRGPEEKRGVGFSVAPKVVGTGCGQPAIGSSAEQEPSQGAPVKPIGDSFGGPNIGVRPLGLRTRAQAAGILAVNAVRPGADCATVLRV